MGGRPTVALAIKRSDSIIILNTECQDAFVVLFMLMYAGTSKENRRPLDQDLYYPGNRLTSSTTYRILNHVLFHDSTLPTIIIEYGVNIDKKY